MKTFKHTHIKKERLIWIAVTLVLAASLGVVFISPAVYAQSKQAETDRLLLEFEWVFRFIQQKYVDEIDPAVLMKGAMNGLFGSLNDPHSAYLDEQAMRSLNDTTSGEFGGVGIYISKADPGNTPPPQGEALWVEVIAPIEGTPAFKSGLNAGDYISAINGQAVDTLTSDEVVTRLRGAPGSTVTVTIRRGGSTVFNVTLTREIIVVPTVRYAMMPGGIGYLRIIQFTPKTAADVQKALQDLNAQGMSRLTIDLRNNPGGLLKAVIETADLFFSNGIIVSTKSRLKSENSVFNAFPGQVIPDKIPMAVLIDKGSASASEILAGALKDRKRAILIGETTYGKGSVQEVHPLGIRGFRLTMSRYYTPADVSIDKVGIKPDIEIKEPALTEAEAAALTEIVEKRVMEQFVKENPNPSPETIAKFVTGLRRSGNVLNERLLTRLVRNAVNRTVNTPPVFDLEYDVVLQEAVKYLSAQKTVAERQ